MASQPKEQERLYTPEDLWELSHQEERKFFELVEGRIVEVSPASAAHTELEGWVFFHILTHVSRNDLGVVSTGDGGYILFPDTVVAPDVGFLSKARLTPETDKYYPVPPDLAVEIVSPSDTPGKIRRKVQLYLRAGTRLVWVFYPDEKFVDVYRADGTISSLEGEDALDGEDVLPGFTMKVGEIYRHLREG